ncbi:hypothetical protein BGAL_0038g00090 [Botrytis galanthina]|uniref:Cation efflux protein cytoplasmic domain-containing protein n=1 Tax=Botrytis galanthina TaxID=278940 RepID=A0A4S8R9H3_9HELO|nr:hypothetical protein BGAL_0038g00090 [Botrytis galanthina]
MAFSKAQRLTVVICISTSFFLAELSIGFYTKSLALVADAFHYLNDLIGFMVALAALRVSQRSDSPDSLSYGWQRAELLGAFFNGCFLLALGVSIALQSIDRFVYLEKVKNPQLMLIIGCAGLTLNIISAVFLHDHDHHGHHHGHHHSHGERPIPSTVDIEQMSSDTLCATTVSTSSLNTSKNLREDRHKGHCHMVQPSNGRSEPRDLAHLAVMLHVIMDAVNNIGVIIAALVIWRTKYEGRFYADPGVSMGISLMLIFSSLPIIKNAGAIMLQSVPSGININNVKHDIENIAGILSIHELHIWSLCQRKTVASAHIVTIETDLKSFMKQVKLIRECLHAYGIHSVTLQAEASNGVIINGTGADEKCQMVCGSLCEDLACCS